MPVRNYLGFTYHDAATCDYEELAASVNLRRSINGGIAFSRKMGMGRKIDSKKYAARQQVLNLFTSDVWPRKLSMLTFPGLKWEFERLLLGNRMQAQFGGMSECETHLHAVESDHAIFRAALRFMPGIKGLNLRIVNATTVATGVVREYQCVGFEDYVWSPNFSDYYNAAWLDFTGFLTERRLDSIAHFWNASPSMECLVVTLMNARQPKSITRKLKIGGTGALLASRMLGAKCEAEMTYADPAPMIQVVLRRSMEGQ